MSTFRMIEHKCGLCGHVFTSRTLTSTNAFGSPDLDLRPPQMKRGTMPMWIKRCPDCGYVHEDIEKDGKQHKAFVKSQEYITCEGARLSSNLARDFYKFALILLREGNNLGAYNAFLCAAWAEDDLRCKEEAAFCRNKAISLYDEKLFKKNPNMELRHIDLLRRAGRFKDAINFCKSIRLKDALMKKIAGFQFELASVKDSGCYRITDCDAVIMKLSDASFELIKSGKKKIEVRCNDEKCRKLKCGDKIHFHKSSNSEEVVCVKIIDLQSFDTFKELYESFSSGMFGLEGKSVKKMLLKTDEIYSKEEQKKYGAVAIIVTPCPRSNRK